MPVRHLPLPRVLHQGCAGPDVTAVQRTLWRLGLLSLRKWGFWGTGTTGAMKKFQLAHTIPATGYMAQRTLDALDEHMDDYSVLLMQRTYTKLHPVRTRRQIAVERALYSIKYAAFSRYAGPGSPFIPYRMNWLRDPTKVPQYADCSSWYRWATHPAVVSTDQSWPTTWSEWPAAQHTSLFALKPGDAIFCGSRNTHVYMPVGNGRGVSDGSETGPQIVAVGYRTDYYGFGHYPSLDVKA